MHTASHQALTRYSHPKKSPLIRKSKTREQKSEKVKRKNKNAVVASKNQITMKETFLTRQVRAIGTSEDELSAFASQVPTLSSEKTRQTIGYHTGKSPDVYKIKNPQLQYADNLRQSRGARRNVHNSRHSKSSGEYNSRSTLACPINNG